MRVAVVGHVEWVDFVPVERVPVAGEIIQSQDAFAEPAGGGAVAAVQLAKLAAGSSFFTALGSDDFGDYSSTRLAELGVCLHAARREAPTRRAFTYLDASGQRTITTLGARLAPTGRDALPWEELSQTDAVYLTAGDADTARRARAARVVVATPRAGSALEAIAIDALVYSANDLEERDVAASLAVKPSLTVATEGAEGGSWVTADGLAGRWAPADPPGAVVDQYGAGDSFAAGLTYGMGAGRSITEAIELAARCGAWCASALGPYAGQLQSA